MRRLLPILVLALLAAPSIAAAQGSEFGVRGLGLPGRWLSVRALGTGGAYGPFDSESSVNPSSLGNVSATTAIFTSVQGFRSSEGPAGEASGKGARFPQMLVAAPLRRVPLVAALSYSTYTARDFSVITSGTTSIRGQEVGFVDTLTSKGGLSDLRLAAAWRGVPGWTFGGGFHIISGSNRLQLRREFSDTLYINAPQSSEVSFDGFGVSFGVARQFGQRLAIAAHVRSDGHVDVDRDTLAQVAQVDLPYSFGGGVRFRATDQLDLAGSALFSTWRDANAELVAQGSPGSGNTLDLAFGGQFTPDPRRTTRLPIRFGVHWRELPFLLTSNPDLQPSEFGIAVGSGLRFAQDRAGVDVSLERTWRAAGDAYKEQVWQIGVGISVRP